MRYLLCIGTFLLISDLAAAGSNCTVIGCPKIGCLKCNDTCPIGEVLVRSPCNNCCLDRCVPRRNVCPEPEIQCLWCPRCAEGYTLVKSPCGCCYDKCVPNEIYEKCPKSPIQCFWCPWSCPKGKKLIESPCGCCYNKCVDNSCDAE